MEELLALPPAKRTALGERARTRVAEHFEIGRAVKRYEAFYEELAEIGRGRSLLPPAGHAGLMIVAGSPPTGRWNID